MLPNEVLQNIFSFLQPELRRNPNIVAPREFDEEAARQFTLSCLLRASRGFYQLALPFLYHTIPVTSDKLLGVLSQNASLAARVKAISMCSTGIPGTPPAILSDALEAARPRLELPDSFERVLFEAIRAADEGSAGAEEVLYLLLLPNVQTFEYRSHSDANRTMMRFFADVPYARGLPLREVRIHHWDTEGTSKITKIHRLLVPTVETFRGWALSWEMTAGDQAWGLEGRLPRLRHIALVEGTINDVGMADLLARCPGLQTLRVEWGSPVHPSNHFLNFTGMGEALRQHGGALESLTLDCSAEFSYVEKESLGRLGSLRELTRLRVLRVPLDVLVGDDDPDLDEGEVPPLPLDQVLPFSIERLHLMSCQDDEEDLDAQVVSLIQEGSPFTRLCRIQMSRSEEFSGNVEKLGFRLFHNRDRMILTKN